MEIWKTGHVTWDMRKPKQKDLTVLFPNAVVQEVVRREKRKKEKKILPLNPG